MSYAMFVLYLAGMAVSYRLLDYWRRHQPHVMVPTRLIMTMSALWPFMAFALVGKDLWIHARHLYRNLTGLRDSTQGAEQQR